jgi:hypothetical protein
LPRTYPLVNHAPEEILHSPGSRRKKAPLAGPQEPTGSDVITAVTSPASSSGPPSPGLSQDKHQQGTTGGSAGVSSRRKSGGFSAWAGESSSNSNSSSNSIINNSNSSSSNNSSRAVVGEEAARLAPRPPSQQHSPHPAVMKNLMEPHQNQGEFDKLLSVTYQCYRSLSLCSQKSVVNPCWPLSFFILQVNLLFF